MCFEFKFIVKPVGQEGRLFRVKLVRKFKVISLLNHIRDRKLVCEYGVMVQVVVCSCMWEERKGDFLLIL